MPDNQKKKTGRQNYDWAVIKHDYVTDPRMTLRKIAQKYGINYKTVALRSKADDWFATRKQHQSKVAQKALSQAANRQAKELAKELDFLESMKGYMSRMLQDPDQFNRHLVVSTSIEKDGSYTSTEERVFQKVDTRAMKDSMQVLQMMEALTRSLMDIQHLETMQKHEIDAERLKLEREKFEFEKEKAAFYRPDASNTIQITGMEPEWSE